ncbi:hypothetical protein [Nocardiopsis deserti]|uniref:hypothetical protein n=1 Tax=Nocardiopsis deserti TaxID=2605988 RepID=UPI00123C009B|nr:hypothetical protein [Nocardiopsis deserti]
MSVLDVFLAVVAIVVVGVIPLAVCVVSIVDDFRYGGSRSDSGHRGGGEGGSGGGGDGGGGGGC